MQRLRRIDTRITHAFLAPHVMNGGEKATGRSSYRSSYDGPCYPTSGDLKRYVMLGCFSNRHSWWRGIAEDELPEMSQTVRTPRALRGRATAHVY